jgi:hypothetical protein
MRGLGPRIHFRAHGIEKLDSRIKPGTDGRRSMR